MTDKFDPNLKTIMDEIDVILKKNGVFGFVNLCSRTHGEFRYFFPEHSVMFFDGPGQLRFRSKTSDGSTKKEDLEHTVFALMSFRDQAASLLRTMEFLIHKVRTKIEIEHSPGEIYPHGED